MLMYLQCIVANIDADAEANRPLAQQYGVQSFPTIKFFPKGGDPIEYEGGRQEADFVRFLNEKCGTHRAVGGGLNDEVGVCGTFFGTCFDHDQAGRHPEFDKLASKFFTATGTARDAVYKEASVLAAEVGPAAAHYLRVMEKVVSGTEGYYTKESKRYVRTSQSHNCTPDILLMSLRPRFHSLASILQKGVSSSAKLDGIKVKANVLAAFAVEKVAEVRDTIERAIEEL
jgi:protein disulfide-isomerase A6